MKVKIKLVDVKAQKRKAEFLFIQKTVRKRPRGLVPNLCNLVAWLEGGRGEPGHKSGGPAQAHMSTAQLVQAVG